MDCVMACRKIFYVFNRSSKVSKARSNGIGVCSQGRKQRYKKNVDDESQIVFLIPTLSLLTVLENRYGEKK